MIKLIKSTFYKEKKTKDALISFIRGAGQLSFGPRCEQFEREFSAWQERKQCVMLNSGSSANLAIVQTFLNLGLLKRGDLVGFSSLTWSTNVMPLIQLGLRAVPVDVELATLNVSSQKLLPILAQYPLKMLFLTNLLGFCDDIDAIADVCRKRKILLIEDNCESLGSIYKGRKLGNYGIASTFSFYVGHHMSTIEGGAVCTDDEEIATMLRLVRAHGWDRNLSFAKQAEMRNKFKVNSTFYSRYTFYDLGYNLRPTEVNGLLGTIQLGYLQEILERRNQNFLSMAGAIYSRTQRYYPVRYNHMDFHSNFAVPVVCRSKAVRDMLVRKCEGKIEIRPIVGGDMTKQPFFHSYMKPFAGILRKSNASLIHEQGLYFGNNPELTEREMKTIVRIFTHA